MESFSVEKGLEYFYLGIGCFYRLLLGLCCFLAYARLELVYHEVCIYVAVILRSLIRWVECFVLLSSSKSQAITHSLVLLEKDPREPFIFTSL